MIVFCTELPHTVNTFLPLWPYYSGSKESAQHKFCIIYSPQKSKISILSTGGLFFFCVLTVDHKHLKAALPDLSVNREQSRGSFTSFYGNLNEADNHAEKEPECHLVAAGGARAQTATRSRLSRGHVVEQHPCQQHPLQEEAKTSRVSRYSHTWRGLGLPYASTEASFYFI